MTTQADYYVEGTTLYFRGEQRSHPAYIVRGSRFTVFAILTGGDWSAQSCWMSCREAVAELNRICDQLNASRASTVEA